jgi:hypothetical protein
MGINIHGISRIYRRSKTLSQSRVEEVKPYPYTGDVKYLVARRIKGSIL